MVYVACVEEMGLCTGADGGVHSTSLRGLLNDRRACDVAFPDLSRYQVMKGVMTRW